MIESKKTELARALLIVPCFNESLRIQKDKFIQETPPNVDLLFANDGSTDHTAQVLKNICVSRPGFYAFNSPKNSGKANVIHEAFLSLKSKDQLHPYTWIGFWDADLATPLAEINNFIIYQNYFSVKSTALFGCRLARYGAKINRSLLRHYLSRIFVTATDLILGIKAYDSQCGAKLFHRSIADKIFEKPFISKWIFDLEIILRAGSENVLEIPVFEWVDVPGSKLKIGREIFRVLFEIFKIKQNYK